MLYERAAFADARRTRRCCPTSAAACRHARGRAGRAVRVRPDRWPGGRSPEPARRRRRAAPARPPARHARPRAPLRRASRRSAGPAASASARTMPYPSCVDGSTSASAAANSACQRLRRRLGRGRAPVPARSGSASAAPDARGVGRVAILLSDKVEGDVRAKPGDGGQRVQDALARRPVPDQEQPEAAPTPNPSPVRAGRGARLPLPLAWGGGQVGERAGARGSMCVPARPHHLDPCPTAARPSGPSAPSSRWCRSPGRRLSASATPPAAPRRARTGRPAPSSGGGAPAAPAAPQPARAAAGPSSAPPPGPGGQARPPRRRPSARGRAPTPGAGRPPDRAASAWTGRPPRRPASHAPAARRRSARRRGSRP